MDNGLLIIKLIDLFFKKFSILKKILTKKQKDSAKIVAQAPDEDFIPYVCHYDPNTIITKNGELLQIIRVTGFSGDAAASLTSLREIVRDAIVDNVKSNNWKSL